DRRVFDAVLAVGETVRPAGAAGRVRRAVCAEWEARVEGLRRVRVDGGERVRVRGAGTSGERREGDLRRDGGGSEILHDGRRVAAYALRVLRGVRAIDRRAAGGDAVGCRRDRVLDARLVGLWVH